MKIFSIVLSACLFGSHCALAQCPALIGPVSQNVEEEGYEQPRYGGGSPLSSIDSGRSFFGMTAGKEDSKGVLAYALNSSAFLQNAENEITGGCSQALTFSFSAPIGKDKTTAKVSSLDSFANAYTFKVGFTRYVDEFRIGDMRAMRDQLRIDAGDPKLGLNRANLEKQYGRNDQRLSDFDRLVSDPSSWFYGLEYEVGRKEHEYLDLNAFSKQVDEYTSWSAGVYAGREISMWLLSGKLNFGESLTDKDEVFQCRPSAAASTLDCIKGIAGAPGKTDSMKLTLEARRRFANLGISPSVYHDFEKDVSGIDIPVFLWQDSKSQFTGGVSAGWRDDTKDTVYDLFVTAPF